MSSLVWRLDRWGRSVTDLLATLQELEHLGVGFVSLTEALDLTTPAGRAMAALLAVFAELRTRNPRGARAGRTGSCPAERQASGPPHQRPPCMPTKSANCTAPASANLRSPAASNRSHFCAPYPRRSAQEEIDLAFQLRSAPENTHWKRKRNPPEESAISRMDRAFNCANCGMRFDEAQAGIRCLIGFERLGKLSSLA